VNDPSPLSRELPWRTTALVAAALAAFELVLLVLLGAAFLVKPLVGGEGSADPPSRAARAAAASGSGGAHAKATARLSREETSVIVLNGNGAPGAASDKAALVQSRGYIVTGTANAPRTDFARSIVMYRRGFRGEAERLAHDFKVRRVSPLDGLAPVDLEGAHLALIVGAL
jgi:hypothetical protein